MNDINFEYVDHTADIEFKAFGRTLKKAFLSSAFAFAEAITDTSKVKEVKEFEIDVQSEDLVTLLYDFLEKLLIIHDSENIVFSNFMIKSIRRTMIDIDKEGWALRCKAYGDKINLDKHEIDACIKAITFSDMKIEKVSTGFNVRVVLDI